MTQNTILSSHRSGSTHDNNNIILSRVINSKLYTMIFDINIIAIKLIPYYELSDDNFRKLSNYSKVSLRKEIV